MRLCAQSVYHLHPVKNCAELQTWSAHSLHVGACVLLHLQGHTDTQIQHLLRWKSQAFRHYIRNLAFFSQGRNEAINSAMAMPSIL
jgi:hypothetical protein